MLSARKEVLCAKNALRESWIIDNTLQLVSEKKNLKKSENWI